MLALLASVELAPAQTVLLTPKCTPGRSAYVEEATEIWFGLGAGDDDAIVYTRVTLGVLETVESTSNNGVRLQRTINRVAVQFHAPPLPATGCDTDRVDPPAGAPALKDALAPLLGRRYTIDLDVEHRAASVSGLDSIRTALRDQAKTDPALMSLAAALNEPHVRKEWSLLATPALYPHRRVRVGDSWTWDGVEQAGSAGDLLAAYRCLLVKVASDAGRRIATVDFDADLRPLATSPASVVAPHGGFRFQHGSLSGWAKFDVLSGRYVKLESESKLTLRRTEGADDPNSDGRALSIRVKRSASVISLSQRIKQKRE